MENKGKYLSLALKNAIVYILLIFISSIFLGLLFYKLSSGLILSASSQQLEHNTELIRMKFQSYVENIQRDIEFLSNNPNIDHFLSDVKIDEFKAIRTRLSKEFLELLNSNPDYNQVRLIGLADGGREMIRVDRINGKTEIVTEDHLQQKGDRNYFLETSKMQKDMVYFSEIDLNREFGKISVPYIPTLRVAAPMYVDNTLKAIVIINADLRSFFHELKITAGSNTQLYLVNDEGHFLIHPDSFKVFGFEFNVPPGIDKLIPGFIANKESLPNQKNVEIKKNDESLIMDIKNMNYPRSKYELYAILASDKSKILSPFIQWRLKLFFTSLLITIGFLLIAWWWMRKQSEELKNIIGSIVSFSKDYNTSQLNLHSNDEIGELAESFNNMASVIRNNVNELEKAKQLAQKANKEKEEFLENMSHEIRNPLHGILGMTRLLEQNAPRTDQTAFIHSLQFNTKQLLSLVNDILDFSKIRIGQIQLHPENTYIYTLLEQIINSHRFFALSKKVNLHFEADVNLKNDVLFIDPLRLSQIINNLLTNAIKFTPEKGNVTLKLNSDDQKYIVQVIDTGVGMSKEEIEQIFKRYHSRNISSFEIGQDGMGIGLSIVTQLLQLLGASLKLDSKPNLGSTFTFELPVQQNQMETVNVKDEFQEVQLPESVKHILCIDDDPQQLFLFQHLFQGLTLDCLSHFEDIPKNQNFAYYDLIITDWRMDNETILPYLTHLAKLNKQHAKIIVLSGYGQQELKQSPDKFIDLYLQKPVLPDQLINHISSLFKQVNWNAPDINPLINDYDGQSDKICFALDILCKEWESMHINMSIALQQNDKIGFEAVFHKLITTLRRFDLHVLKSKLQELELKFNKEEVIAESDKKQIDQAFTFYKEYFEALVIKLKGKNEQTSHPN